MDSLNQKIVSSFDKNQDRALVSGVYGFNETSGKWNYIEENGSGALSVDVHGGSIGSGDVKARTNPADPNTSQFLKCNANNHLKTQIIGFDGSEFRDLKCDSEGKLMTEITAEIQAEGLATEAKQDTLISNQTNGTSKVQVLGNTSSDGSGSQRHLLTDVQGHLQVDVLNQNQEAQLAGFTDINNVGSVKRCLVDNDGHLQVDVLSSGTLTISGDAQVKAEDDTGSARNIRCNNSGHVKSQLIGNTVGDGSGTNKVVQTNDAGQLKVKLIAEDNTATRREVRCNTVGHIQTAMLGNTAGDGSGTIKNILTDTDGKLIISNPGGGSSASNSYPTLASITTGINFAAGKRESAYVDLSSAKNVVINCIHTGDATARTNFAQDISLSVEFTDDDTNTVCYSGASSPVFASSAIDAVGNSTGSALAVISVGENSEASGQITGKFCRVVAVNNNASGTSTAYAVDFKVVISAI